VKFLTDTLFLRHTALFVVVFGLVSSISIALLIVRSQAMLPTHSSLVFSDSFDGAHLDRSKWGTCYPWFDGTGCTNHGNPELEWYLPQQVSVQGGALHLTALRSPVLGFDRDGRQMEFPYRSGMVTTAGHFQFTFGRVEVQARSPRGRGFWPALWLLAADGSGRPEIDLMEAYCENVWQVLLTYHPKQGDPAQYIAFVNDISSGWHSYAVDWSPGSLIWYVDGRRVFTVDNDVPHQPMYLIANLGVSGRSPHYPDASTPATAQIEIASVRVWSSPPSA
jgi:beta-glucanase (GH16 family)